MGLVRLVQALRLSRCRSDEMTRWDEMCFDYLGYRGVGSRDRGIKGLRILRMLRIFEDIRGCDQEREIETKMMMILMRYIDIYEKPPS